MLETAQIALRLAILLVVIPVVLLCVKWTVDSLRAPVAEEESKRTAEAEPQEGCYAQDTANPANPFRFSPELFESRADVIAKLEERGFMWLSQYSSVDCLHDVHGLEVCGIHERKDALAIQKTLTRMFPKWKSG